MPFSFTCVLCSAAFVRPNRRPARYCTTACQARGLRGAEKAKGPLEARFWAKVDRNGPVPSHRPELGQCWVWTASTTKLGYGQITVGPPRRSRKAHQIAWEIANGPIPEGLWVLHHCDNPPCVRSDHLFLGDVVANSRDMWAKGRSNFQLRPQDRQSGERHWTHTKPERVARGPRKAKTMDCRKEHGV